MKKYIILAAALATMASCTKNASLEVAPVAEDEAIGFSAYSGTAATKGTVVATSDVIAKDKGIGVFAFYQPATNGVANKFNSTKFASPDFMYDTQVKPVDVSVDPIVWAYSPLKFWPNNEGDLISFFAYTPYDENKTWEDLGFKTDVNATKLTASFPVYTEKTAMEDYVFATPALNKSKQNIGGAKIHFDFKHIMSRVAIQIGAVDDKVSAEGPQAWTQPVDGTGTVITVESIEFQGIAESYDYTYTIETGKETWKENGSQNLLLTAKAGDFQNNTSDKWVKAKDKESAPMPWLPLLAEESYGTSTRSGYLFIAPQDLTNANLVITYTVATTDKSNPANNSTIKNVITKPVNVNFLSGKAYTLNLLIGMKKVEISASVGDWTDGTPATTQIDVPANKSFIYPESGTSGIEIDGVVWAPVNCGYDATTYPYGKLYQFGRMDGCGYNDGSTYTENVIQTYDSATTTDMTDPAKFYKNWTATEWTAANDPCPEGWRVPTKDELGSLCYTDWDVYTGKGAQIRGFWDSTNTVWNYADGLFLPAAGYRLYFDGRASNRGDDGSYWSSSVSGDGSWSLYFNDSGALLLSDSRAGGSSVRCVQE